MYENIFNELDKYESIFTDRWLFNAVSYRGQSVTTGTYEGYGQYCELSDYFEEISVLTGQSTGIKGVCAINVVFTLIKGEGSLGLYNEFISNNVFKSMDIIKIVKVKNDLKIEQQITFNNCKIENFKIFFDKVIFSIKYTSREEVYTRLNGAGYKQGCSVSLTGD